MTFAQTNFQERSINVKKLALFLAVLMAASLVACGEGKTDAGEKTPSKDTVVSSDVTDSSDGTATDSSEATSSEEKKLELKENVEYVVVCRKEDDYVINSTDDFAKYVVGYVEKTDSMVYAMYYNFKNDHENNEGRYSVFHDLNTGMRDEGEGRLDLAIFPKSSIENLYADDYKIVWDFSANK